MTNIPQQLCRYRRLNSEKNESDMDNFFWLLGKTPSENKEYNVIILGDWNSKVRKNERVIVTVGSFSIGSK